MDFPSFATPFNILEDIQNNNQNSYKDFVILIDKFTSNKVEKKLIKLIEVYKDKVIPTMPIGANTLMAKYNIPEGKILGNKLKMIEEAWVENGFTISEKNIQKIAKG